MKIFSFRTETLMPISQEEAWDFFSIAANLEKITPPKVKFETLTRLGNIRIYDGMRINYRLRPLLNIPLKWETEIRCVNAPNQFMDKQLKGPYAFWEHTHTFVPVPGGVKMIDEIKYALPMGWLGIFMHSIVVKKQLGEIFKFREGAVKKLFGAHKHP